MDEKVYRTLTVSGAGSIAAGIVSLVIGVAVGVICIITGAGLLKARKNILL